MEAKKPGFIGDSRHTVGAFNQPGGYLFLLQRDIDDGLHVRDHLRRAGFGCAFVQIESTRVLLGTQRREAFGIGRCQTGEFLGFFDRRFERSIVQIIGRISAGLRIARHGDGDVLAQSQRGRGDAVVGEPGVRLFGGGHGYLALRERGISDYFLSQFLCFVASQHESSSLVSL